MAIFSRHHLRCSCGHSFDIRLARSVNATRSPQLRRAILEGKLHRFRCPACHREGTVERAFNYVDPRRGTIIRVQPRQERHTWKEASWALERDAERIPDGIIERSQRRLRVAFGMSELREKLVAEDAGFDDRVAELLKVFVVQDHPFLTQRSRLRMALTAVDDSEATFTASFDHGREAFRCRLPRKHIGELVASPERVVRWSSAAHKKSSLFELDRDHWVNMWRWSPQPSALASLSTFGRAVRAGKPIKTGSAEFKRMLRGLPRGKSLPATAKRDLQSLFDYAKRKKLGKVQDSLFEIRFGIELDDDWAQNDDPQDIATLWKLLKNLPDSNVEGNVALDQILLADGEGGGWYEPWTHDIYIGTDELGSREGLEDVMRHEVGHAVHEMMTAKVDQWLRQRFGWEAFEADVAGVDRWVSRLGGWGSLTPSQRDDVRGYLLTALGPGEKWEPGPAPNAPPGHPWNAPGFGPRLAYEHTGPDWFQSFKTWHVANGKAFFLNYYYRSFMVVDAATLQLIEKMPSDYAAMSPFEFFAEVYALYYDLDDPKRPHLPADVATWLDDKIGEIEATAPRPAGLRPAHRSGGVRIRRPGGGRGTSARRGGLKP